MEILHAQNETPKDESDGILSCFFEIVESGWALIDESVGISSLGPFHDEVEELLISEGIVEGGDELIFALLQYFLFEFDVGC